MRHGMPDERALFDDMLEEQDVDIMAWAHGTADAARALRRSHDRGAEEARLHPDRAMSEPLQRVLRADRAADPGRRADGLPAVARRRSCARRAWHRAKAAARSSIVADEAAMRALAETVPLFAPEVEVLTLPGWDCLPYDRASPALRVMAERLATLNALQAQARQAAAAGRHRQRRHAASADAVPHPPAHPAHRRRRADRARGADRAAERARLPARRHRRRAWRICRSRLADRPVPRRRGARAAARFLRRRDRQHAPLRPRRPALDRQGRRPSP